MEVNDNKAIKEANCHRYKKKERKEKVKKV